MVPERIPEIFARPDDDFSRQHHTIIEFGPNMWPLVEAFDIPASMHPAYLGVDNTTQRLEVFAKDTKTEIPIALRQESLTDLAFLRGTELDDTAMCIPLMNVMSALDDEGAVSCMLVIKKLIRMLRPGGKLIIGEWYTPDETHVTELTRILETCGFSIIRNRDDAYRALKSSRFSDSKAEEIAASMDKKPDDSRHAFLFVYEKK